MTFAKVNLCLFDQDCFATSAMGKHRRHPISSSSKVSDVPAMNLSNGNAGDSIWHDPDELDLLEMKKSPLVETQSQCPTRTLQATFDSICPDIYRPRCGDALRTLQELVCLAEEHVHVHLSSTVSPCDLLTNEKSLEDFLFKLQQPVFYRKKTYPTRTTELRCFGSGIRPYHPHNELHQPSVFCLELTSTVPSSLSLPVDVRIVDPDGNAVAVDVQYINTYNHGCTKLFSCQYAPSSRAGMYRVSLAHDDVKVMNQQHMVFVRNPPLNNGAL